MWDIIFGLLVALALVPLVINYAHIGAATRRALEIRLHGRAWLLTQVLALLWPVTLTVLATRDLVLRDHSQPVLLGEAAYRSKVVARQGSTQLSGEAEIRRVHEEWQSRVNYFYALGAQAEAEQDWLMGQHVAENLDFLLETEPPRPPEKENTVPKKEVVRKSPLPVSPRPAPKQSVETPENYFCNVCANWRASGLFALYQVAGICDTCIDEIHEGDE